MRHNLSEFLPSVHWVDAQKQATQLLSLSFVHKSLITSPGTLQYPGINWYHTKSFYISSLPMP